MGSSKRLHRLASTNPTAAQIGTSIRDWYTHDPVGRDRDSRDLRDALQRAKAPQFAKDDWETEDENAKDGIDILRAWGMRKSKVTAAEAFDDHVVLEVDGERFEGMQGFELVRMVEAEGGWRYDGGARIGLLRD